MVPKGRNRQGHEFAHENFFLKMSQIDTMQMHRPFLKQTGIIVKSKSSRLEHNYEKMSI